MHSDEPLLEVARMIREAEARARRENGGELAAEELRALKMIAGCPSGVNEAALTQHGFEQVLLDQLLAAELVMAYTVRMERPRGMVVRRFHVTAAGRARVGK